MAVPPRKLKLAMIGCGTIFKYHLDAINELPGKRIDVTVVVEPNETRREAAVASVKEKLGTTPQSFPTLQAALDADPSSDLFEAVDVMVPSIGALHEEVAVVALQRHRHVILEKPVALSLASAERILAAAPPDKVLMVAENAQYWREVVRAKELVDGGAIGELLTARAKFWESAHPVLNAWAAAGCYDPGAFQVEEAEGPIFDGGLHFVRPLRMWLGEVTQVAAIASAALPHMKGPTITNALFQFASGKNAIFESLLAPSAISEQPFFTLQGTKGEIVLDGFAGGGRLYTIVDGAMRCTDINESHSGPVGWDTGYTGELEDFAAAVLDGKPLAAGPREGVEDLRVMMAMMKAAKTHRWEHVKDVEPDLDMQKLAVLN